MSMSIVSSRTLDFAALERRIVLRPWFSLATGVSFDKTRVAGVDHYLFKNEWCSARATVSRNASGLGYDWTLHFNAKDEPSWKNWTSTVPSSTRPHAENVVMCTLADYLDLFLEQRKRWINRVADARELSLAAGLDVPTRNLYIYAPR